LSGRPIQAILTQLIAKYHSDGTAEMTELLLEAERIVESIPFDLLKANRIFVDRVKDNPEASRYFLAYGDWGRVSAAEIFESLDPALAPDTELYVDFPFCPTICNFCAFYPVRPRDASDMAYYVKNLKVEVALLKELYFDQGFLVETIELGGGTPTYLPLDLLRDSLTAILESFPIKPGGEHNFETTPEGILGEDGMAKAEFLRREAGFDRISIGAQSFSDKVLTSSNRSHNCRQIYSAFETARALEFKRINLDLLLGLADQTLADFVESVEKCVELDTDIIEIYTMRYFDTKKPVPLTRRYLEQPFRFLSERELLTGRVAADLILRDAGYASTNGRTYQKQDSSSHYYSDYYKGNFQGKNILGIGRKSFSRLHDWQYANYSNIEKYSAALENGQLPIAAGCNLDAGALLARRITGALQLEDGLDYELIKKDFDEHLRDPFDGLLETFVKCGLMSLSSAGLRKTDLGFLFIEEMLKAVYDTGVTPFSSNSIFLGKSQLVDNLRGRPVADN
jgi:oxygen-independent coproporphyrinogen III oxidase